MRQSFSKSFVRKEQKLWIFLLMANLLLGLVFYSDFTSKLSAHVRDFREGKIAITYQIVTSCGIVTALIFNLHLRGGRSGTPNRGLSHDAIWELKKSEQQAKIFWVQKGTFGFNIQIGAD